MNFNYGKKNGRIEENLSREVYLRYLNESDAILLPYNIWNYQYSSSGIFIEAVSAGKVPLVSDGLWISGELKKHDLEGRIITAEFKDYFLVTVYTPNSKRELLRLDYRQKEWDVDFLKHLKELEEKKPVVFCGDLNVAHKEIDLKNPKTNKCLKPENSGKFWGEFEQ